MTFLPSLEDDAVIYHVLKAFPETARPLLEFHEILMRGPSPLSAAERELIAAYVSALNGCVYCTGVHTATAEALGVERGLVGRLVDGLESVPGVDRLRPILRYVRILTRRPDAVARADAEAVLQVAWNERALHDAVQVCALFNFMNRFVEGLGIEGNPKYFEVAGKRIAEGGYRSLMRMLGMSTSEAVG